MRQRISQARWLDEVGSGAENILPMYIRCRPWQRRFYHWRLPGILLVINNEQSFFHDVTGGEEESCHGSPYHFAGERNATVPSFRSAGRSGDVAIRKILIIFFFKTLFVFSEKAKVKLTDF